MKDKSAPPTSPAEPGRSKSQAGTFIDPAALMRIRNLQLRAKVVVDGFLSGLHRSPFHGFSVEFTEYRQYTPGDDLRFLDWRLYARTDRFYLKRFEDETNLRCWLLVDLSRSMGYASLGYDKADYARTAAATIAYFLTLQRDAVGLITFDQAIREFMPARYRRGHLRRLMICLEHATAGKSTDLTAPLEQIARTARKRGLVVLLSDLLAPAEAIDSQLGCLRSQGHEVVVIRVLDPAEVSFEFREESLFFDLETGRELFIEPHSARVRYQQQFQEHAQAIQRICGSLGIDMYELTTDKPLEMALFDLLNSRLRQRPVARRHGLLAGTGGGERR